MEDLIRRFNWLDYETGFLCASKPPCQRLEDPYYEQWEAALKLLPSLLLACQVRPYIECRVLIHSLSNFQFYLRSFLI